MVAFRQMVPSHTYSVGHVLWFVSLVLSSATSLRGASRAMAISLAVCQLPSAAPSWFPGRLWLLRLGYYKLSRPKEQADDWVWIVDHTVPLGTEKCLVILGVRLGALPAQGSCLNHEDVEPLTLLPVKQSNGDIVYQQLEATGEKTGIPRQIVGDQGSDLHAGITAFCQAHTETCSIYDIKHKTASVLKKALQADDQWLAFTHCAAQTKARVQQTALACLAPPNQRAKARYMNVGPLIRWARHALLVVDEPKRLGKQELAPELLEEKLGWLRNFRDRLDAWGELLQVVEVTEHVVRTQGVYRGLHRVLKARLAPVARRSRAKQMSAHLVTFVAEESLKAKPHERLLGSSEVIESVFGTLKHLEQDQAKSGFTGLVLSLAAIVSSTTTEVVQKALETVPTKQVLAWCKQTLGQSVQAKRRKVFASRKKREQKRDQFKVAV